MLLTDSGGYDPRSEVEIQLEAEAKNKEEKAKKSQERQQSAREKYLENLRQEQSEAAVLLSRVTASSIMPFLFQMQKEEIREYRRESSKTDENRTWLNAEAMQVVGDLLRQVGALKITEDTPERSAIAYLKRAIKYVEQHIMSALASLNPDWFEKTAKGNWTLTKVNKRAPVSKDKETVAITRSIQRLIDKYPTDKIQQTVCKMLDLTASGKPFVTMQDTRSAPLVVEPPASPVPTPPVAPTPPAPPVAPTPPAPPAPPVPTPPAAPTPPAPPAPPVAPTPPVSSDVPPPIPSLL